jgi:hypothetical protein
MISSHESLGEPLVIHIRQQLTADTTTDLFPHNPGSVRNILLTTLVVDDRM